MNGHRGFGVLHIEGWNLQLAGKLDMIKFTIRSRLSCLSIEPERKLFVLAFWLFGRCCMHACDTVGFFSHEIFWIQYIPDET